MTDIVERLRKTASRGVSVWGDLQMEAADEIDALRTALAQPAVDGFGGNLDSAFDSTAPAPVVPADELRTAANALLHQIDIGDFVDSNGHSAKMLKATHDLMRALSAAPAPVVPDGWVMVPREPTEKMIEAPFVGKVEPQDFHSHKKSREWMAENYRAMIAAAPGSAPAVQPLTADQIWAIAVQCTIGGSLHADKFARAIEAHHGIGITGGGK